MGWLARGLPCPWGGHRHVMSCPLPQLGLGLHVPLSRLAMGEGAAAGSGPVLSQEVPAAAPTGGARRVRGWVGGEA